VAALLLVLQRHLHVGLASCSCYRPRGTRASAARRLRLALLLPPSWPTAAAFKSSDFIVLLRVPALPLLVAIPPDRALPGDQSIQGRRCAERNNCPLLNDHNYIVLLANMFVAINVGNLLCQRL